MEKLKRAEIFPLAASIILCQLAGLLGYLFNRPIISTWYAELNKPGLTPPDWVFAPVWIGLYFLMAVAAFLVWRKGIDRNEVQVALSFFGLQLVLNALWPFFFFELRSPLAGLVEISLLGLAILLTIHKFLQVSRTAGFLLIPYFMWVAFATGLNLTIWWVNC